MSQTSRLLALPGEIRMMIYRALFTREEPIEIKRRPIRLWCEVESLWFLVDTTTCNVTQSHQSHPGCSHRISEVLGTDLFLTSNVHTHAAHFPCPRSLAGCDLNLNLLLACRKIYWEARNVPYAENTFLTKQLSALSNFIYCLKRWQIRSISHLAFRIPETHGMTKFLAEWNDIFSLIAASFSGLRTVSVHVQLYDPLFACWSSFWDGGLLELDRLELKGLEVIILHGDMKPYFTFSAGTGPKSSQQSSPCYGLVSENPNGVTKVPSTNSATSQSHPVKFNRCRDCLRQAHEYDQNNDADLQLFFRFSWNPCPLYVRNLIHLLTLRKRLDADIRREDILQRELSYHYAYQMNDSDAGRGDPIIGYQFSDTNIAEEEIARNVEKLRLSRQRLADKLRSRESNTNHSRQLGDKKVDRIDAGHTRDVHTKVRRRVSPPDDTIDTEPRGQWRRRLNEENYSPFFESFPPQTAVDKTAHVSRLSCTECANSTDDIKCFLHA